LGITQDSYGAQLIPVVWGKLPTEVKRNLARENNDSNWSIDQLREVLLREIRILEQGASTLYPSISSPKITVSFHVGFRVLTNIEVTDQKEVPISQLFIRNQHVFIARVHTPLITVM